MGCCMPGMHVASGELHQLAEILSLAVCEIIGPCTIEMLAQLCGMHINV